MKLAPRSQAVNFLPSGRAEPAAAAALRGSRSSASSASRAFTSPAQGWAAAEFPQKSPPQTTQGLRMLAQTHGFPTGRSSPRPIRGSSCALKCPIPIKLKHSRTSVGVSESSRFNGKRRFSLPNKCSLAQDCIHSRQLLTPAARNPQHGREQICNCEPRKSLRDDIAGERLC